ncbi:non-classical arabinogalactan protein 30 [Mangifera indica]|uniref:non-classical arabinogalactan protein 30 n=1 Tax=Mangifera indica TaxID=29780 RepID=UPI001CFB9E63|nr:non-classical arabinogalactan protein 30 [Mangifera indica]
MASNNFRIIVSSLLLLSLVFPSMAGNENTPAVGKTVDVVVEGMVYCQSCKHYGTWSLSEAEPIASAKVSVVCKNEKDQVSYYKAFQTNDNGYFYAQLAGFKMNNYLVEHPLQSCTVKLVSSPLENCSLLSNVNYGMYGAPLQYEGKRLFGKSYEAVIYAAGPLAFRPSNCPTRA